jgi:hypothetical protein
MSSDRSTRISMFAVCGGLFDNEFECSIRRFAIRRRRGRRHTFHMLMPSLLVGVLIAEAGATSLSPPTLFTKNHPRKRKLPTCRVICHTLSLSCETLKKSGLVVTTLLVLLNHLSMHYMNSPKADDIERRRWAWNSCYTLSEEYIRYRKTFQGHRIPRSQKMAIPFIRLVSASHSGSSYPADSSMASSPTSSAASSWVTVAS